jgi:hypothetical protein
MQKGTKLAAALGEFTRLYAIRTTDTPPNSSGPQPRAASSLERPSWGSLVGDPR